VHNSERKSSGSDHGSLSTYQFCPFCLFRLCLTRNRAPSSSHEPFLPFFPYPPSMLPHSIFTQNPVQQTADSRQQTADSRQQTADSRQRQQRNSLIKSAGHTRARNADAMNSFASRSDIFPTHGPVLQVPSVKPSFKQLVVLVDRQMSYVFFRAGVVARFMSLCAQNLSQNNENAQRTFSRTPYFAVVCQICLLPLSSISLRLCEI
jgi:hypothetical protein